MPVWVLRTGVTIAVLVGIYLAFEFGRIQAAYNIVDAIEERESFEAEIGDLRREIVALREEIALLETHRDIDREAYRDVEGSLADMQRKIQEQRDAIAFYRGIVSPVDGGRGLRVQDLKLLKGGDDREYHIKLVLVQVMQHDRAVTGDVALTVEGSQDGVLTTYSFDQLAGPEEDGGWSFSFRYFQDFDRLVMLPAGFEPERINIEVRSKTKSIASIEESFLWQTTQS